MRKRIALLCCLLCLTATLLNGAPPQAAGVSEEEILYYVNQHRERIGKPPMRILSAITPECERHSRDMARDGKLHHDGFDDRIARIRKHTRMSGAGENVAYGQLNSKEVVDLWLGSKGHRRNIEGDFELTGIGMATARDGTIFFTQIFIAE